MITTAFLLFAGDDFYPGGGWTDFVARFDSLEEAKEFIVQNKKSYDWVEIVECNNLNFSLVYKRNFNKEELDKKIKKFNSPRKEK
jgi:hypothetical protein